MDNDNIDEYPTMQQCPNCDDGMLKLQIEARVEFDKKGVPVEILRNITLNCTFYMIDECDYFDVITEELVEEEIEEQDIEDEVYAGDDFEDIICGCCGAIIMGTEMDKCFCTDGMCDNCEDFGEMETLRSLFSEIKEDDDDGRDYDF